MDRSDEADVLHFHLAPSGRDVLDLEACDRRDHELVPIGDALRAEHLERVAVRRFEDREVLGFETEVQAQDVLRERHGLGVAVRRTAEPPDPEDSHEGYVRSTRSMERAFPVASSASM